MTMKDVARQTAAVANVLLMLSLLLVLVWWRASAYLFLAGCLGFAAKGLMDGASDSAPSIARE